MKRVLKSTVLIAAAVPFLVAAPVPKQAANSGQAEQQQATAPTKTKTHKKHVKKSQNAGSQNGTAAQPNSSPAK